MPEQASEHTGPQPIHAQRGGGHPDPQSYHQQAAQGRGPQASHPPYLPGSRRKGLILSKYSEPLVFWKAIRALG